MTWYQEGTTFNVCNTSAAFKKPRRTIRQRYSVFAVLTTVCCALTFLFSTGAHAVPVVDQQNLGPVAGNVGYEATLARGQSFTVGLDGVLAGFEFNFNKSQTIATGNAYLSVYSTNGIGAPDVLLGQVTLDATAVSTTHSLTYFDLTPLGLAVSTGDLMFAALHADFAGGMYSTRDIYAGGTEWGCGPPFGITCWTPEDNSVHELVFRSFVDTGIPEPGMLAVFGLGLAGLGIARQRRLQPRRVA